MAKKKTAKKTETKDKHDCASMSALYGLGFIGAAIYYVTVATGFWNGVLGVLKALVWPAFLVFETFKFLGM
ncbi:MAG: hypothetical protein ACLFO2_01120 [Candidatus Woesearchaeota archaeon]